MQAVCQQNIRLPAFLAACLATRSWLPRGCLSELTSARNVFDFCRAMVVGTFKLGLKATSGDGVWYHDSGELTDDMSASDALGDYNKSFK